ncbi:MAG: YraN family protein [Dehalococcoidia bacterium]|nr:YraN family protein [Dehalococcoidia bacterium]
MTARQQLGAFGERLAVHRLEAAGLRIVARNVRVPAGEIDILAEDGDDLVFVEVRTRRSIPGVAAESLTPTKLRRMWQCAMDYCERESADPERVRIDVVSIDLGRGGRVEVVEHFRGVEIPD